MTTPTDTPDHEILRILDAAGLPLCTNLREMLNEHYSHCTERRGCGYTQATRVLAGHVNAPREAESLADWALFDEDVAKPLAWLLARAASQGLPLAGWRHLDRDPQVRAFLATTADQGAPDSLSAVLARQVALQQALRLSPAQVAQEESRLLLDMICDILLPDEPQTGMPVLRSLPEKPKVGSCTLAEKFFLEIAHDVIIRKGRINVIVDDNGQPLLMEKLNMGDSHSCLSLAPAVMNGVRIPPGSLLAAEYDPVQLPESAVRPCRKLKGQIIPASLCTGFRFLRLTTLAVKPAIRARAFGAHVTRQADSGFFGYDTTDISRLQQIARDQI